MNIFSYINKKLNESYLFIIVFFFILSFTCTTLYSSIKKDLNQKVPVKTEIRGDIIKK